MEELHVVKKFSDHDLAVLSNNIVEAKYDMTAPQLKLFIAFVSLIGKDDTKFKQYVIDQNLLIDLLGIDKDSIFKELFVLSKSLVEKSMYIRDDEKREFKIYNIFSTMEFKNGLLIAELSEKIRPYILQLKEKFTKFELGEFKPFQSKYSIRIYQLLKQYYRIGERTFKLEDLRAMLMIEKNELVNFRNFRVKVIEPAQRELENTPMAFDWEVSEKQRKKVVAIRFILKNKQALKELEEIDEFVKEQSDTQAIKKQTQPTSIQSIIQSTEPEEQRTFDTILKLIPDDKRTDNTKILLLNLLKQYPSDYIATQIAYTNAHKPKEYLAYLKKAIQEDYADYKIVSEEEAGEKERKKRALENGLKQLEAERIHSIEVDVDREKARIYREYIDMLSSEEINETLRSYLQKAKELYPDVAEKSHEMEFKIECLITEDIIAKNEIYQKRLEKAKAKAKEKAQKEFEWGKEKLIREYEIREF